MNLAFPSRPRSSRSSATLRDRKARSRIFRPEGLEACEDRLMMTVGLVASGTLTLTTPYFNGLSLSNSVGFNAPAPSLSADGQTILFTFDNSKGTGPVTVDIDTYLTQSTGDHPLQGPQILENVSSYTIAAGSSIVAAQPLHACTQLDAFVQSAVVNGKAYGSNPIVHLNPIFDQPGFTNFASPVTETGFNTTGFVPTSTTSTPPPGTLGTLVATTSTTGPLDNAPGDYCPPALLSGVVNSTCICSPSGLAGQEVDLSGFSRNNLGNLVPFSLATTTAAGGAYSFTVPYADLPAVNFAASVPLGGGYTLNSATPGTIDGVKVGAPVLSPTSESITGLALNFGASVGSGFNFSVNPPASVAGTIYADATGNGLNADGSPQAGDTGLAGVVVQLLNGSGAVVSASAPTTSTGAYSIAGVAAGTYTIKEVLPAGYEQTGGPGSSTLTLMPCQAVVGENYSALPTCDPSMITGLSFTDVSSLGTKTYGSLGGNTNEGDQVTANLTNSGKTPITVSLVTYTATQGYDLTQQSVFQVSTVTIAPGASASLPVQIPNSFYQIDFVCGPAITKFNPAAGDTYHGENRFLASDNDGSEWAPNTGYNPGTQVAPTFASLGGQVFVDKDLNGVFSQAAGDAGIGGVAVQLTGKDTLGNKVNLTRITGADGSYNFAGLQPGSYTVTEIQPAGYQSTRNAVGTVNGATDGTLAGINTISSVTLAPTNNGVAYNFGEGIAGCTLGAGEAASAGYWAGSKGQCLLTSLNGGSKATNLGTWLASSLPNLFAGLAGQTDAQVAAYAAGMVGSCGWKPNAGVLALALSAYVTDSTLAGTVAASYGFVVSAGGTAGCTVNACNDLSSWGGPTGTITIGQFLMFADDHSANGVLGNGDCTLTQLLNDGFALITWFGDIKEC